MVSKLVSLFAENSRLAELGIMPTLSQFCDVAVSFDEKQVGDVC